MIYNKNDVNYILCGYYSYTGNMMYFEIGRVNFKKLITTKKHYSYQYLLMLTNCKLTLSSKVVNI